MLSERDICAKLQRVKVTRLRVWVRQGWIRPAAEPPHGFSEADLARAALIRDLEDTLGFDEDQVPVLLNLIDQIHGLRAELRTALTALEAVPADARRELRLRITKAKPAPRRRR
jgi:chaperone modulatory protein CbpM